MQMEWKRWIALYYMEMGKLAMDFFFFFDYLASQKFLELLNKLS